MSYLALSLSCCSDSAHGRQWCRRDRGEEEILEVCEIGANNNISYVNQERILATKEMWLITIVNEVANIIMSYD